MNYQTLFDFERCLAEFTGAPYVVVTDCCTHAIELCLRYDRVRELVMTPYTYVSIPMTMHKLGIKYYYREESWTGEYQFHGTRIWDSARRLEKNMYRSGARQCVSFGNTKPLQLGRCGAILLDDHQAYTKLSQWRSDGRDLSLSPWQSQSKFDLGFHYCPTLETCQLGIEKLSTFTGTIQEVEYPDCRRLNIS